MMKNKEKETASKMLKDHFKEVKLYVEGFGDAIRLTQQNKVRNKRKNLSVILYTFLYIIIGTVGFIASVAEGFAGFYLLGHIIILWTEYQITHGRWAKRY